MSRKNAKNSITYIIRIITAYNSRKTTTTATDLNFRLPYNFMKKINFNDNDEEAKKTSREIKLN